jgi:hypothetical protein
MPVNLARRTDSMAHDIQMPRFGTAGGGQSIMASKFCPGTEWSLQFDDGVKPDLRWLGVLLCAVSSCVSIATATYVIVQLT